MRKGIQLVLVASSALSFGVNQVVGEEVVPKIPKSFQECVEHGGQIQESFPSVCVSKEGVRFAQPVTEKKKACVDRCGDGQCQEIVCMAVGCPCSETPESCPKDCVE